MCLVSCLLNCWRPVKADDGDDDDSFHNLEDDEELRRGALATVRALNPVLLGMDSTVTTNGKSVNNSKSAAATAIDHTTSYHPNLCSLTTRLIELHDQDPNLAQVALMNLLFRSVGGGRESDLPDGRGDGNTADNDENNSEIEMNDDDESKPDKSKPIAILEEMDSASWARIVTDLVDDMRHRPPNQILLCADPRGAIHQSNSTTTGAGTNTTSKSAKQQKEARHTTALLEYRKIYTQFWYILSSSLLTNSALTTSERLDANSIREVLQRLMDLSPVGQPDVRAAACLAVLSASCAVLDRSIGMRKKLEVARRQYGAEKKKRGGNSSGKSEEGEKAESLKVRMESLGRTCGDLEEVVEMVVQGLFVHRYR